eukprot:jgi/Bigna1/79115/fgenesh1_pg.59_\
MSIILLCMWAAVKHVFPRISGGWIDQHRTQHLTYSIRLMEASAFDSTTFVAFSQCRAMRSTFAVYETQCLELNLACDKTFAVYELDLTSVKRSVVHSFSKTVQDLACSQIFVLETSYYLLPSFPLSPRASWASEISLHPGCPSVMGCICCCHRAAVLMDASFHVNATPLQVDAHLRNPDSWLMIIPNFQSGNVSNRKYDKSGGEVENKSSGLLRSFMVSNKSNTVVFEEIDDPNPQNETSSRKLAYRITLFSTNDVENANATFNVEWTFKEGGTEEGGSDVRRYITDFKAFRSTFLPWTLGLKSSCREENMRLQEAFV